MIDRGSYSTLVVVDTETTGQDPFSHEILSIGMAAVGSTAATELHVSLPSDAAWTEFGRKNFVRFEQEWRMAARAPGDVVRLIESFIQSNFGGKEVNLVGHNMAFDRFFLAKLAHRAGVIAIKGISHRTIDTFSLLMGLHLSGRLPLNATTSDGAFEHFGITIPAAQRHTALGDALATKELFLKVMEEMGKPFPDPWLT